MHPLVLPALHRRILSAVSRAGALSRADVSRKLGVSRSKLSPEIAALVARGLLVPQGLDESSGGRRGSLLACGGPEVAVLAGVDIDTHRISVVVTTLGMHPLAEHRIDLAVADDPARALDLAADAVERCLPPARSSLAAIGISIAADIEPVSGRPVAPPTMPRWSGWPVAEYFANRFGVRAFIDNDVNALALAEAQARSRAGQTSPHGEALMVLKVSSGLGCGIVIDGTVFRGSRGSAGDIGHICVDPHHEARCVCGNRGCLEVVASAPAIIRRAEDLARTGESALLATMLAEHPRLTLDLLGEASSAGDPAAVSLLRETGSHIGFVLAGLVSFFNPHAIVISSGIAGGEDILLSAIRQMVYQRALPASTRDLQIVDLAFTPDAGALGAAVLACEGFLGTAGRVAQARPPASAARSV